ncbi:MAG: ATP-binding cassette domain-containing protein [Nitriliruptoraceae bacterium]
MSLTVDVRASVGDPLSPSGAFHLDARFEVAGGLTVVAGPSGAGKTRLLRLLAGLDRPSDGRIALDGEPFCDLASGVHLPAHERRIGMVFQQPFLLPHRSIRSNVALAVRTGTRADRRDEAMELLEQVGGVDLAHRRPGQLSGGQQQRVALARALAGHPRLLLLDEPFSALDVPVRDRLRRIVRDLVSTAGLPTLFVTHDPDELLVLADRVLLAEHGRFMTVTDPDGAIAAMRAPGPQDRPAR